MYYDVHNTILRHCLATPAQRAHLFSTSRTAVNSKDSGLPSCHRGPELSATGLAEADVEIETSREYAALPLAIILLHNDPVLVLQDRREHKPVVLDVLANTVLLVQAVVTCRTDLHGRLCTAGKSE
jgi:hypothetical protein